MSDRRNVLQIVEFLQVEWRRQERKEGEVGIETSVFPGERGLGFEFYRGRVTCKGWMRLKEGQS